MPGRFKSFINDLNEQERRAAEERAIENENRQRIADEFERHWQTVLQSLKQTVFGCSIKGSPFEWVADSDGINVANVGLHWSRTENNGIPVVDLELGSPVGIQSFIIDQKKSLPPEVHLLSPVISNQEFCWQLGSRGKGVLGAEYTDYEVADEIAMLLAQYADEYEKLKVKFDPFANIQGSRSILTDEN
ncbi:MAG TPA: hypothetical protein VMU92_07345 [Acidobacteriaceae bacterium]|nr:hypothetical protein [Acidobacteriaceae bacterium]